MIEAKETRFQFLTISFLLDRTMETFFKLSGCDQLNTFYRIWKNGYCYLLGSRYLILFHERTTAQPTQHDVVCFLPRLFSKKIF